MLDLAILNGEVLDPVDGRKKANVGVKNGKIARVSQEDLEAAQVIDAAGLVISPGFIDIHTHENEPLENGDVSVETLEHMAKMGVTLAVGGNCGINFCGYDVPEFYSMMEAAGVPIHFMNYASHGYFREKLGCDRYDKLPETQYEDLAAMVRTSLEGGAVGVSVGLEYTPGANLRELLCVADAVAEFPGRLLAIHYRYDAKRALEAIAEMVIAARETGASVQVSHIGSGAAFGQMSVALNMIDAARDEGVDVTTDVYPYDAFSTFIGSPVFDPGCFERWGKSYDAIFVAEGRYKGQYCNEHIFRELREKAPDTRVIAFMMREDEVVKALQHPSVMIASDGHIKNGNGHPRGAGTFPRVLGHYVRDRNELPLMDAIKKMTLLPAERLGLADHKGRIAEGYDADLTVFNEEEVIDQATYEEPTAAPKGIEHVLVAGQAVVSGSEYLGGGAGTVIRK